MAQPTTSSHYVQGHDSNTTATQELRKASSEAAFLLPHIKSTDRILDAGCGPGTITTSFSYYVSEGSVVGIDMSAEVLEKAKGLAARAKILTEGPGSVTFKQANITDGSPFQDDSFDIVFASQVMGHFPPGDLPVQALTEMKRVLKPGGVLATRDQAEAFFYPKSCDLERLWTGNLQRTILKGAPASEATGKNMPSLLRRAGFDADKVKIGVGANSFSGAETRKLLLKRATGQLSAGEPLRRSCMDAGISEDEIGEMLRAIQKWAETDDAWTAALHCEMLAWK